uniref:SHC-transforming protein 3 n=1 Tax=Scatophagus argus TaxID=75038 RepID=UPI001ED80B98|nr:SHC-transforming protein 3 [Scatophagus argus]XP_046230213.1 SHC-transforming protein 3 [Scatophagus argus]XP_046230214.1 SHC-transforming protein 3 [Scatophagus argus]XP_046230215.1 SHC-transforming protein 3 [Scatophagus argus]XP_046230216.1 SHC-transforming protein 3 [Scatophagus argus]XP_046230217.1 SHC-transforming protein 3 [Scatophagus argus]XP_046230218.1 SHC-transforming protein 3 [Scatophagus argus]
MLHRTKYNRFRNESVTSVDELLHGLSMNPKVSATPHSAAETSYTPPTEVQSSSTTTASSTPTSHGSDHLEDGGTTLCTLINKVSSLKFSNSGSLLGIKSLPSAVKDLAVSKLQAGGGSGSGSSSCPNPSAATAAEAAAASGVGGSLCSSASHSTPCSQLEPAIGMSKKSRLEELQPSRVDWNPGGGGALVSKPSRGWLHSSEKISGPGVTYIVKYLGCIEVLRSMRSLDFTTRSQITREAISLVCEAVPGTKGALRKRKPPSKALSSILGKSNLQFAGMSINLNISTSSLNLMTPDGKQIIANHHMQSISFASGGDPDTTDYVAYVAKDPVNRRACHILECSDGLAQDVISTIGQAFDLRFQQYLQCPSSKLSSTHDRVLNMEELPWTEEEEESVEHPYYNNIPGKMPPPGGFIDTRLANQNAAPDGCQIGPGTVDQTYYQGRHCGENWGEERRTIFIQQGSFDISGLPDSKNQAPKTGEMPAYVNTQQIDAQVLAALQAEAENVTKGMAAVAKESPQKDLFDMKPFEDAIQSQSHPPSQGAAQSQASSLHKAASVDNSSPLLVRSLAFRAQEELEGQTWYHGIMSRRDAEKLLKDDGDFLVRKSTTNPGSYVLTGMHNGLAKHLLLVDPEGTVRTKDHIFDSITHLIGHHRDNNLPIVSAGSELCLLQPVGRKQ